MMINITIPDYDPQNGFQFIWENGFEVKTEMDEDCIVLRANKEGLISLAQQFLLLAQDSFPKGYHLHYDSYGGLEDGSKELIISKM